ncbi:helix-turn-helix domain-containing protein [Streptomyces sp. AC512_CC834]|uniref:helix-turn-helix domain-containing protein n=1 Tax=Streptomyces sp. AC512_CC834 TaxID=2823691 RepID=UPI001C27303C|nr:helix-turn-helix domain-containing protein [Streptomyces sp. AC512_CC834]
MTEQNPSAPTRPVSGRHPGGVEHENHPHHDHFTVVGNHLLQHPELSLTAIGLAVHIQSLPAGTPVGIKSLAGKFPEGEIRIAAALRELEEHGYLARTKERLQSGRVVTRTVSRNKPRAAFAAAWPARPVADEPSSPAPSPATAPVVGVGSAPVVAPETELVANPAATELLVRLRVHDSRLLLTERDVRRLAPAVMAWLERGVPPTAVERTLTAGLPQEPIRHPAAFLERRLTSDLPPALPAPRTPAPGPRRPDPLQTCDGCERAFRASRPGRCRDCRERPLSEQAAA